MAEFMMAINRMIDGAIQAKDDVTAIDLALDGQEEEITSNTCDAASSGYWSESRSRLVTSRRRAAGLHQG